jgi:hypothetical protein
MRKNLKSMMMRLCAMGIMLLAIPVVLFAETVGVFFDSKVPQINFAAGDVKIALESKGFKVEILPLTALDAKYATKKVVIALASNVDMAKLLASGGGIVPSGLGEQAYNLQTTNKPQKSYWVFGGDANGAMYGALEIAENIKFDGFKETYNSQQSPAILKRGVKLNLPFDEKSPTYERNHKGTSYQKAIPHVWDITFWEEWFDEMARHRYNMVSVWNNHPFTSLVLLPEYPDLAIQDVTGFDGYTKKMTIQEKIEFWRQVMKLAHARGFEFLFFNWNVWVANADGKYGLANAETSDANKTYMYKSMMKLLETYPDLDGFGVTNGENKSNQEFLWAAYGKAMYDYAVKNPERKLRFIHRWHQTSLADIKKTFAGLFELPNVTFDMSYKYSKAHMYSTPVPKHFEKFNTSKQLVENNMRTWFTVRNDDFYYNTWGDPSYARTYLNSMMEYGKHYAGFYIGSDGFCPTRTFFCKNSISQGILEVQRQWYMNMIWGRLAYNPNTPDDVFLNYFKLRYPAVSPEKLFTAWSKSSSGIQRTTELTHEDFDLDFKWYPEACLTYKGFATVDLFGLADVGPGSSLCNIKNSATGKCDGKKSSYQLADEIEVDALVALKIVNAMSAKPNTELWVAVNNIKALSFLSLYYAQKIRGATFKLAGDEPNTTTALGKAWCWWINYTNLMDKMYEGQANQRTNPILPDWHFQDATVLKEYNDNGGTGVPDFKQLKIELQ